MIPLLLVPWVGLPLERAAAIGAEPTLSRVADDLRLAWPSGFATLIVSASDVEADAAFDGMKRTAATHWPLNAAGLPGDRAIGDGTGIVLVRDRNVVLLVRDREGKAREKAEQLLAGLTTDAAVCAPVSSESDGERWNACGRRL